MPDVVLNFPQGQTVVTTPDSGPGTILINVLRDNAPTGGSSGPVSINSVVGLRAELDELRALINTAPEIIVPPAVGTPASIVPNSGVVGTEFTINLGTYTGTNPTLTHTLTQAGVNVTSSIVGGTFVSTASGPLVLTVTATNQAGSTTSTDSSVINPPEVTPEPGSVPLVTNFPLTGVRQIHSGHSLTDVMFQFGNTYYGTLAVLAEYIGVEDVYNTIRKSTMPGSQTEARWNAAPDQFGPGDNARYNIADYDLLSITEGGPLAKPYSDEVYTELQFRANMTYLKLFIQNARTNGAGGDGARTFLYTMWPNIDDAWGPFRETLNEYERTWHHMQERVNNELGGYLHVIPGHRVMMRVYDDIQAGLVPGITDIHQLFLDDIHPNGWVSYAVSCLHMEIIYGVDARTLPHDFVVRSDALFEPPVPEDQRLTPALGTYMKTIAHEIARGYARAGRGGTDMGLLGIRPTPELQTPRQIVGDRLAFSVAYGEGPAGPVTQIVGDGVTLNTVSTAQAPVRSNGYLRFGGNAFMHGVVSLSGPRYVLRIIRINSRIGQHLDTSLLFNVNDVGWQGQNMALQENLASSFLSSNPSMASVSLSRELGEFWLMERYWGPTESWGRIQDREKMRITQQTTSSFPATTKIQVGGALDAGTFADPTFFFADVDLVADVVVRGLPTEEERYSLIHWAKSIGPITP